MFFLFLLKTEAVLTSTHNLCFRAKIRKNVYPCKPQFYYIKVGCKGVYITLTCYHDVIRLTICFLGVLSTFGFCGRNFGSDCTSVWSLLTLNFT